jgi:hypothetical protein
MYLWSCALTTDALGASEAQASAAFFTVAWVA